MNRFSLHGVYKIGFAIFVWSVGVELRPVFAFAFQKYFLKNLKKNYFFF
jgi:uncharacterized transporter YbjL